jgi:PadR family transcriptional regulator, regulatory protein PadR
MNIDNIQAQMRKGILEYCILAILAEGDKYVPDITSILKEAKLIVVEGTLYPLLNRQKNAGLLTYRWQESTLGPPRKYYIITNKGLDVLESLDKAWTELIQSVEIIRKIAAKQ